MMGERETLRSMGERERDIEMDGGERGTERGRRVSHSVLPPMMKRPFSLLGKDGSSLTARARLVSGAMATRET